MARDAEGSEKRPMQVEVNKEIRGYRENIFFGLSTRQFFCSVLAVGVAVGLYFLLPFGKETVSWMCIVGAVPFAAVGFFSYHGMTMERFIAAWFKSTMLGAGRRLYKSENYFYYALYASATKKRGQKKNRPKKGGE